MNSRDLELFQAFVLRFHADHGRHELPWRTHQSPYHVLVSEIMLQQTQVDRVVPKFLQFVATFPTLESLAHAPISEVIRQWQGLGYNRRGLNLQRTAQSILNNFSGEVPPTVAELLSLPGIGPYTAAAIQAFAFNQPTVVIETNIRAVYIYHFFHEAYNVSDTELTPLIQETIWQNDPRTWYSALMDYGTYLKKVLPNPSRKSRHYVQQSKFIGSLRQVRGRILAELSQNESLSASQLFIRLDTEPAKAEKALNSLLAEGFLEKHSDLISLKR